MKDIKEFLFEKCCDKKDCKDSETNPEKAKEQQDEETCPKCGKKKSECTCGKDTE